MRIWGKTADAPLPPTPTLEELARKKFPTPPLSDAELKLVRAAPEGGMADCRQPDAGPHHPANDPKYADDPMYAADWNSPGRQIRADLIRWLCVDREAKKRIDPRGIQVSHAKITGQLDLSFAPVRFPLRFFRCAFAEQLNFLCSDLELLFLAGSQTKGIEASVARVRAGVVLGEGFSAEGEVRLLGADIGGTLECDNGSFKNAQGRALAADSAKVGGSVLLRNGFSAEGEVGLLGADIGGALECDRGSFKNAQATALSAERARVGGSVLLRNGFTAEGGVSLLGANIGGDLDCSTGSFKNAQGRALSPERAKVGGSAFLRNGFSAEGEVRLLGADIGGSLECDRGTFKNAQGTALQAANVKVRGAVLLRNGFSAEGEVSLLGADIGIDLDTTGADLKAATLNLLRAKVGTLRDDPTSWPDEGRLYLDGFVYDRISYGPTNAKSRLKWLRLQLPPAEHERSSRFSPQPYQQLAKVLREQGHDAEARKVLIGLEDDRRKYGGLTWYMGLWAFILKWTIGYGYRPIQALGGIALFWAVGFVVFGSAYRAGELVPSDNTAYDAYKKDARHQLPGYYERFCALAYSFDTVVPIIDLGQRSRWKPIDNSDEGVRPPPCNSNAAVCLACDVSLSPDARRKFPEGLVRPLGRLLSYRYLRALSVVRFFRWVDIVAGWFFATMFAVGITGLVRRD